MACSVPFVKLSIIYIFVYADTSLFVDFINTQSWPTSSAGSDFTQCIEVFHAAR